MAVTWEVTITPLDVARKTARIVGVRTDDTDLQNILVETHTVMDAILDTAQQKNDVLDNLWQQHLAHQTRQAAIDNYTGGLEATAKANLEARE
jgi:hypothetical protein